MLGLGNSLVTGGPVEVLKGLYTSDFTSDVDGWYAQSIDEGDLNLTANQTIDGTGGWLKGTFTETQTSGFILLRKTLTSSETGWDDISVNDWYTVTYKIYIVDDSNKWGSSPPITHSFKSGSVTHNTDVAYDTTTSVSITKTTALDGIAVIDFDFTPEKPSADAVFYIKDFVYTRYGI